MQHIVSLSFSPQSGHFASSTRSHFVHQIASGKRSFYNLLHGNFRSWKQNRSLIVFSVSPFTQICYSPVLILSRSLARIAAAIASFTSSRRYIRTLHSFLLLRWDVVKMVRYPRFPCSSLLAISCKNGPSCTMSPLKRLSLVFNRKESIHTMRKGMKQDQQRFERESETEDGYYQRGGSIFQWLMGFPSFVSTAIEGNSPCVQNCDTKWRSKCSGCQPQKNTRMLLFLVVGTYGSPETDVFTLSRTFCSTAHNKAAHQYCHSNGKNVCGLLRFHYILSSRSGEFCWMFMQQMTSRTTSGFTLCQEESVFLPQVCRRRRECPASGTASVKLYYIWLPLSW